MRDWNATEIARASEADLASAPAGARTQPGPRRVTIDSRRVAPGDLFVGLRGERTDGGRYAAEALRAGAWGVLVAPEHALGAPVAAALGAGGVVLGHPDPLHGLQALARAWRRELGAAGARVVAITGSTGKTSTKDILAAILSKELRTVASPENLNTEIGMPLAILHAPVGSEVLVLELAMRGPGQIAELTAIAEPDVGVIVNIGPAHLELLGSLEAIAEAKAELIAGLASGASIVIPADQPLLAPHLRSDLQTVTFGAGGDFALEHWRPAALLADRALAGSVEPGAGAGEAVISERRRASARSDGARAEARIVLRPSFGAAHNLQNLLAAVAAARALGVTPGGELEVRFSALRGERLALGDGIVLIDDCYNANPMSMRAAIDELAASAPARRVAVLGDMLELGPGARELHREIGEHASARGIELIVTVGPLAREMHETFAGEALAVADAPAAVESLQGLLRKGDTVLVKGSRGVGLEHVAAALGARRGPAGAQQGDPRVEAHSAGGRRR